MDARADRFMVIESDDILRTKIVAALTDAGYEASTSLGDGIKSIVELRPDVVILGANPPQLDCCDLVSQLKSSEHTQDVRVLMLSPGGAGERTRGLDLGADDVLSLPFDVHELLSRVRAQLRSKHRLDGLLEERRLAEGNVESNQQVVSAVNEERRALRRSGLAILGLFIAVGLYTVLSNRHAQQQNTRVYAAISRLQTGILTQQQLIERSRRAQEVSSRNRAGDPHILSLRRECEDLKSKIEGSRTGDAPALQKKLDAVEGRLEKLETEGQYAEKIINSYEPSICLIHVVVTLRDHTTGRVLHYTGITTSGEPTADQHNNPLLSLTGHGPEVRMHFFGTGFLASGAGQILTNHHVAEPWWKNDELQELLDQGLEPVVAGMTAYFPGVPHGIAVKTQKISSVADVALLTGDLSGLQIKRVALADGRQVPVSGGPVVLLGYPTALDAILARAGTEMIQSIVDATNGDPKRVMEELARRQLIRPIATQGHIGDVLPDKIVYDAQTTSGGSGGPLFDDKGKVIGINFAMVRQFGGSNFAIPVVYAKSLLKGQDRFSRRASLGH